MKGKESPMKKCESPVKSPSKKDHSEAENQSSNKEDRKSQRRRRLEVDTKPDEQEGKKENNNHLKVPSPDKGTSPLKSCPKSPVKRMKTLEKKENAQDQENIETTFKKVNDAESAEKQSEEDMEEETDTLEPKFL